jgi:predicted ferric reductase
MKIPIFEGRISPEKLEHLFERYADIDVKEATYFICGPSEMIKGIADYLKKIKKYRLFRFYLNISPLLTKKIRRK